MCLNHFKPQQHSAGIRVIFTFSDLKSSTNVTLMSLEHLGGINSRPPSDRLAHLAGADKACQTMEFLLPQKRKKVVDKSIVYDTLSTNCSN